MKDFRFTLPPWPPFRLVNEAVFTWNIRHIDDELLDPDESPWPQLVGVILAFLRHRLTDYDQHLAELCRRDEAARDELVRAVHKKAYTVYPWLARDPRPFPVSEVTLPLDRAARRLAFLQTAKEHMEILIAETRRLGDRQERLAEMEQTLANCKKRIEKGFGFLTKPRLSPDGEHVRAYLYHKKEEGTDYEIYGRQPLHANEYRYLGFNCPRCAARVIKLSRKCPIGQGHKVTTYACFCLNYAIDEPPAKLALCPMTLEEWTQLAARCDTPDAAFSL